MNKYKISKEEIKEILENIKRFSDEKEEESEFYKGWNSCLDTVFMDLKIKLPSEILQEQCGELYCDCDCHLELNNMCSKCESRHKPLIDDWDGSAGSADPVPLPQTYATGHEPKGSPGTQCFKNKDFATPSIQEQLEKVLLEYYPSNIRIADIILDKFDIKAK